MAKYREGMKVAVEEGRLVVRGRDAGSVCLANIAEVAAEKVDKVTYDEVFLIVREHSGDAVALGELDEGFAQAEAALRAHLTGFPLDWRVGIERAPVGIREQVWPTPT